MTSIAYGRGRDAGERLLRSAARGGILIGVAVVIGIVLLQVVGDGTSGPSGAAPSGNTKKVTTTTGSSARPTQEVVVAVYNGSGLSQAAGTMANKLRGLGYQTPIVSNAATEQTGSTVACQVGFEAEAAQLATVVENSTVQAYPASPPVDAGFANCIIVVGK